MLHLHGPCSCAVPPVGPRLRINSGGKNQDANQSAWAAWVWLLLFNYMLLPLLIIFLGSPWKFTCPSADQFGRTRHKHKPSVSRPKGQVRDKNKPSAQECEATSASSVTSSVTSYISTILSLKKGWGCNEITLGVIVSLGFGTSGRDFTWGSFSASFACLAKSRAKRPRSKSRGALVLAGGWASPLKNMSQLGWWFDIFPIFFMGK